MVESQGSKIVRVFIYIFLIAFAVVCFLPFYLMIVNATRDSGAIAASLSLIPGKEFLNNYGRMRDAGTNIWLGFKNSIFISVTGTLLSAYFGSLTAYGFSMYRFKGRKALFWILMGSMMIPAQLGLIGFFKVINVLNLYGSQWALILPVIANANFVFFVKGYIDTVVPASTVESARIDGAREVGIFNKIVIPMIVPSIATMSIFTFVSLWNSYITPLIVLNDQNKYTIPVITAIARGVYQNDFGAVYVVIALSMVPIIVVFSFCSKYIIGGLTAGSVKG